jgi:hypothetical protein
MKAVKPRSKRWRFVAGDLGGNADRPAGLAGRMAAALPCRPREKRGLLPRAHKGSRRPIEKRRKRVLRESAIAFCPVEETHLSIFFFF